MQRKEYDIHQMHSNYNIADIFTKPLSLYKRNPIMKYLFKGRDNMGS
jgi:hypothetical protein